MEEQLQKSNSSGVWRGLNTLLGHNQNPIFTGTRQWAIELNLFFKSFNQMSNSHSHLSIYTYQLIITAHQHTPIHTFCHTSRSRKAAGPVGISSRLLRRWAVWIVEHNSTWLWSWGEYSTCGRHLVWYLHLWFSTPWTSADTDQWLVHPI